MKQLLLVGSPNSGKSMLFNRLTGMNQRVANFPRITVETSTLATLRRESDRWHLPASLFVGYSVLAYSLALLAFHIF